MKFWSEKGSARDLHEPEIGGGTRGGEFAEDSIMKREESELAGSQPSVRSRGKRGCGEELID